MLVELDIQNFAVIKSLKVSFKENMTVLIGETGAGKSIIIDALSLLLGSRAQIDMIRSGESKAIITGLFSVDDTNKVLIDMCIEAGIPLDDNQLVICRELSIKGRSIVRINGQITTINILKNLSQYLVDIHGQRDMQILMDQDLHINLLDNYANNDFKESLCQYQKIYAKWQEIKQRLSAIRKNAQEIAQKHDILEYQLNELKAANLTDEKEDERVDDEYRQLTNYQKIMTAANYFMQLYEDEQGLSTLLDDGQKTASELAGYSVQFSNFEKTFNDGVYALEDAHEELTSIIDNLEFDSEHYAYLTERINLLNTLKKKYGPTLKDVFIFYDNIQREINQFDNQYFDEEKLDQDLQSLQAKLMTYADELTQARKNNAKILEKKIKQELSSLYMDKARFVIKIEPCNTFNKFGLDKVAFMIATNPGDDLHPLVRIVSGGEQSRLLLALKAIFSESEPVGTMIFDEIDTGVSGRVAAAIGKKMHKIGLAKQVIAITHSPQVAAASDHHFAISKIVKDGETFTKALSLNKDETVITIAKMMAGKDITEISKQNALELITKLHNE